MKHPALPESARDSLDTYRRLLTRYRSTLDLMSAAGLEAWDDHLAGSIDVADALDAPLATSGRPVRTVLDVGSGAGFPGIVIAIARPGVDVHLVERRRRRGSFLTLAVGSLELANAHVHVADVRDLERQSVSPAGVDAVTAQAVAPFDAVYAWSCHLHGAEIRMLSRKGETDEGGVEALEARLSTVLDVRASPTRPRGSLIRFDAPGGRACRSSA